MTYHYKNIYYRLHNWLAWGEALQWALPSSAPASFTLSFCYCQGLAGQSYSSSWNTNKEAIKYYISRFILDECHQNVCTLGVLMRSVLIKVACFFCIWSEIATGKMISKNISEKVSQKNQNFPLKIGYNSGCNMKYTWLLKVEYLLNGCTDLYEIWNLSSWDTYWLPN